jgi:aminoglycoside phosphotransferase
MDLPRELAARFAECAIDAVEIGESGAGVWHCRPVRAPSFYLKAAAIAADQQLDGEAERLRWMKERRVPVPAVREYGQMGGIEYLLLDEVPGMIASDPDWTSSRSEVVSAIGSGLALLHRTSIVDCPFDQRIARQIEAARRRVETGRVREDDFDAARAGRSAVDIFDELLRSVPADEDLVLSHGDFCLPNIVLDRTPSGGVYIAGLVDCGRSGIADRHQDLALAMRSITHNFGREWVSTFLEAYGMRHPSVEKLSLFALLDEFF